LQGRHLERFLGSLKTLERSLAEGIEDDDPRAAAGGIMQFGHHAGTVGARILSDYENRIGEVKVFEDAGTLADPN